ncbi:MAG: TetR/AcrR family transcriptional regulator, partial [Sphingobacteriia bacterium]|nr:TetR/AcrR family transcriptional regulator [Sphingobacteriia bacterium]
MMETNLNNFFHDLVKSDEAQISMTDKQINIMSAAIEIFAKKGYSATTTSEIAKRAGVGEGTIFHYYKTKKDLLLSIPIYLSNSPISKGFVKDLIKIFENPYEKFEDLLRDIISNRKDFLSQNIPLIKVLFQEIPLHPELRTNIAETILFPAMDKLIMAIDRFKKQGQIVDIPSHSIVKLMLTSILGYFFVRYIAAFDFEG